VAHPGGGRRRAGRAGRRRARLRAPPSTSARCASRASPACWPPPPTAVGDVRDIVERFDAYTLQLGRLVTNVSELYDVTSRLPAFEAGDDTVRVLHVSDLHLNPSAFDLIGSVVDQFGIDVIVDTGDLTDFGSAAETRYVSRSAASASPTSTSAATTTAATQATVAAQPNAVVLDGPEVVEVAGLRLLGMGDPRFTPDKTTRDDDAPVDVLIAVGRTLARSVDTALEPPHLVAVHDPLSGGPLLGRTPSCSPATPTSAR
jgi:hypothetical protein